MTDHDARSRPSTRRGDGPPPLLSPDPPAEPGPKRGAKALATRLRTAAESLPGSTNAFELRRRDRQRAGSVLAAGIAARSFLMLLPLAFILAAVGGFLDESVPDFSAHTARAAGLTTNLVKAVGQSAGDARSGRWVLLIVGAVLLVYAAHSLYRALYMTHLVAWEMTRAEVHAGSAVLVSVLLVLLPIMAGLASLGREAPSALLLLLGVPATVVLYSALWLWISWLLPHRADRWTDLVPGALAWGAGLMVLQLITVFLLPDRLSHVSQLYGTLAIASSTIAWLFIIGRLTVGAATLNAILHDRRRQTLHTSRASPA